MANESGASGDRPPRNKPRIQVRFAAVLRTRRGDAPGVVTNISESGAYLEEVDAPLAVGQQLKLRFSFFSDSTPVELPVEVVREKAPKAYAVRFRGLDARSRALLTMAIAKAVKLGQAVEGVPGADDDDDDITLMKVR